ncbi:hypothetical protein [Kordiimonas sp.]|uniref:hypothetical protein n=1 Tax=Kordiimonas sp. TaxID=1970157 RepID=UPI003A907753
MVSGSVGETLAVELPVHGTWRAPEDKPVEGEPVLALVHYRRRDFVAEVRYRGGHWYMADQIVRCYEWLPIRQAEPIK